MEVGILKIFTSFLKNILLKIKDFLKKIIGETYLND